MSKEAIDRLTEDITDRIDYYRQEYDLTYAETIGILAMIQMDLYTEIKDDAEDGDLENG